MVAKFSKYFLPPYLYVKEANVGADKNNIIEVIANMALYQKSDKPPSTTIHVEKYKRKFIKTKEFAKSYKHHLNKFFLFIMQVYHFSVLVSLLYQARTYFQNR